MPLVDLNKEIPDYQSLVAKQDLIRAVAFLGLREKICGIAWFEVIESPFLGFKEWEPARVGTDIAAFFKVVSPFHPARKMLDSLRQKKFMHAVGRLDAGNAISEIREFVSESFMDAPAGSGKNGESYYSSAAAIAHRLCKNYSGLSPDSAVDVPLKVAFQLLKILRAEEQAAVGRKPILFNHLTDAAKSRWMNQQQTN